MPQRIQLRRTKGWRKPAGTIPVGRGTRYGNPFPVQTYGREDALRLFHHFLDRDEAAEYRARIPDLAGHDLACWCGPDEACHADTLLERANPAED